MRNRMVNFLMVLSLMLVVNISHADSLDEQDTAYSVPGLDYRFNVTGFVLGQELEKSSPTNPNNILDIPRHQAELNFRLDLNYSIGKLDLVLKPRYEARRLYWKDGLRSGQNKTEDELFVHEWMARVHLTSELFASLGREDLQWGPSYLLSPSNPFNQSNGRFKPNIEIPGMDYAKITWVPDHQWTASLIANTGEGRQDSFGSFSKTTALKVDYTGNGYYISIVPSHREGSGNQLGWYAHWSTTDYLSLYFEGQHKEKTDDTDYLIGARYTFEDAGTITGEYYHQDSGCTAVQYQNCFIPMPGKDAHDPLSLVRENYLFLQYRENGVFEGTDVALRWIRNLDDKSNRVMAYFEREFGDNTQLFLNAEVYQGKQFTEFDSVLDYSMMIGFSYTQ